MKKYIIIMGFGLAMFSACSGGQEKNDQEEKFKQETMQMDSLQQEIDESVENINEAIDEDLTAADSLLNGI